MATSVEVTCFCKESAGGGRHPVDLHQPYRYASFYYARGGQEALPMRVGGATSQLDLPSLTPMSVAGCG